jgi:GDPmannose 4,6-dehydratase
MGDARKAREKLGWQPRVGFKELVALMVEHDLELAEREKTLKGAGFKSTERGLAAAE